MRSHLKNYREREGPEILQHCNIIALPDPDIGYCRLSVFSLALSSGLLGPTKRVGMHDIHERLFGSKGVNLI